MLRSRLIFTAILVLLGFSTLLQAETKKPRIIALSPHIVEMLYDIGAGEHIIATVEHANYPEQAKNIPRIGNYLGLQTERIVELQPDIIIAWQEGSASADLTRLKQLGFTIIYSDPHTFSDIATALNKLGAITGHKSKATKLANQFMAQLTHLKKNYQNKTKVAAFYQLWPTPLTTIAKGSWPQQYLDICQVKNPFYHSINSYPTVSIEQVISHPIDLIIIPSNNAKHNIEIQQKLSHYWQKWPQINAVKHQQFIYPNADKIHRMTLRTLTELENFCQQIDEVRNFYLTKKP